MRLILNERLRRWEDEAQPYLVSENGLDWHLADDTPPEIAEHWKKYLEETDKLFKFW